MASLSSLPSSLDDLQRLAVYPGWRRRRFVVSAIRKGVERAADTSRIVQRLKIRTAMRILNLLRENPDRAWCRRMLSRIALPPTVHDESHHRVWQRRFYPYGIYSGKKEREKLDYMHNNPVTRGLVSSPRDWPWSSWRFYFMEDTSLIPMDRAE